MKPVKHARHVRLGCPHAHQKIIILMISPLESALNLIRLIHLQSMMPLFFSREATRTQTQFCIRGRLEPASEMPITGAPSSSPRKIGLGVRGLHTVPRIPIYIYMCIYAAINYICIQLYTYMYTRMGHSIHGREGRAVTQSNASHPIAYPRSTFCFWKVSNTTPR